MTDQQRELEEILDRWHPMKMQSLGLMTLRLIEDITAWHLKHSNPKVTREQVIKTIEKYCYARASCPCKCGTNITATWIPSKPLIDDLLTLINGEEKKVWCEHMKYDHAGTKMWIYLSTLHSAELWKFCPSCGTKRPDET